MICYSPQNYMTVQRIIYTKGSRPETKEFALFFDKQINEVSVA